MAHDRRSRQSRRSRRSRLVSRSLLLVAALVAALGATLFLARPAFAAGCSSLGSQSVTDPNTGWHWTTKWICGSRGGAYLYLTGDNRGGNPAPSTPTAIMDSTTTTWFVCWVHGQQHAGGNDIWYYTVGDRAVAGMEGRNKWGYMPAVDVNTPTGSDPWPGMPPCPVASGISRGNHTTNPIYLLHGYQDPVAGSGYADCGMWSDLKGQLRSGNDAPAMTGPIWTVRYYGGDINCAITISTGDQTTPVKELGANLAREIYYRYSRFGVPVDVVGHSMGGLIARAAVWGTQHHDTGYPAYVYVEDAVTMGSPHDGITDETIALCLESLDLWHQMHPLSEGLQCAEMIGGSPFLNWLNQNSNPQSAMGTDWTLIGSDADDTVDSASATSMAGAGHKVIYNASDGIEHSGYPGNQSSTSLSVRAWHYYDPTWRTTTTPMSPIRWAHKALYENHNW